MTTNVDVMTAVLALEDKCAMNYVMNTAWPETYEKFDSDAEACFTEAWAKEQPFLNRIAKIISDSNDELLPLLDDCYDFSPSRLNFSTWSHLLTVVPELLDQEIIWLNQIAKNEIDEAAYKLIVDLLVVKQEGVEAIRAMAVKQAEARAAAAAGEVTEDAGGGGGGDSFRDADMPIEDRMAIAQGKDKFTQLWAAMAQTDCTACGYDCEGYAQAIADGEDSDLTKCVPGEDATANAIKAIMAG